MTGAATRPNGGPVPPVRALGGLVWRLCLAWWPRLAAVAAAAAVVAAAIAGSLGVGAAMHRGLRDLAATRLGGIDAAVIGTEPFGAGIAAALQAAGAADGGPQGIVPAVVLEVAVEHEAGGRPLASRATLLACDDPAGLGFTPAPPPLAAGGVFLNEPLARGINAGAGAAIVLRVPRPSAVPADSPLGRRTTETGGRRFAVTAILPDAGLGRFSLRPAQVTGPLVVTSLGVARDLLGSDDATNVVCAVGAGRGRPAEWLSRQLRPALADFGLALEPAGRAGCPRLTSRRLILPAAVDQAAAAVLGPLGGRPSLVFLVNAIEPVAAAGAAPAARPASIPYSTVVGIDTTTLPVGPLVDAAGRPLALPGADEIVIDRWMADDLAAQGRPVAVGDALELRFFAAETLHGRVVEQTARLRISAVAAMEGAAVAREFVPEVEGITDEKSIADWDPPFPFDAARVRTTPPHDEDDRYWKEHGAAPKAFVSLETARRLAGSRFGTTTAWHLPPLPSPGREALDALRDRLAAAIPPESLGIRVVPLRAEAVAAARGSTPFGGLFLALSSFVVGAGLILEWLLFQLLVAARRRDVGILAAIGWPPRRLVLLLGGIAAVAAAVGAVVGTLVGPVWARLLVAGLSRGWEADVAAGSTAVFQGPAPTLSAVWPGGAIAFFVSLAAVLWAVRRLAASSPLVLLGGATETIGGGRGQARASLAWAALAAAAAAVVALLGRRAGGQAAVGWFFGAGGLALVAALGFVRAWLHGGLRGGPLRSSAGLVGRGLAHAPARGFAVAAIVAVAEFLVVAVSSFAVRPPADPTDHASPTGGWSLVVGFGTPTAVDPAAEENRGGLGMTEAEERAVAGCTIARLRHRDGDAADCTNLYAAARPPVVGVGPDFIARGGFSFADRGRANTNANANANKNPWSLLERAEGAAGPVPAILDQATAQWALKYGGVGDRFVLPDDAGGSVEFEIVALLEPGILQGLVLVADREFTRIFPGRSGYGMALVDDGPLPQAARAAARTGLATAWAEAAPVFTGAVDRLRSLQGVQNTFLAAFQALGTLGLLLGTAGVAAVQVQNAVERAGSLALLRALGFTLAQVRRLLVGETLVAVGLGLVAGAGAACLAVWPALAAGTADVPLGWIAVSAGLAILAATVAAVAAVRQTSIPERPRAA